MWNATYSGWSYLLLWLSNVDVELTSVSARTCVWQVRWIMYRRHALNTLADPAPTCRWPCVVRKAKRRINCNHHCRIMPTVAGPTTQSETLILCSHSWLHKIPNTSFNVVTSAAHLIIVWLWPLTLWSQPSRVNMCLRPAMDHRHPCCYLKPFTF